MKVLLIGASSTIGKRISAELSKKHEVISAGRTNADVEVDVADHLSIEDMYHSVEGIDAVICAAGPAKFGPFGEMSEEDMHVGIRGKMMGQVNLVRIGQNYVNDNGSFTLTTGILADSLSLVRSAFRWLTVRLTVSLWRPLKNCRADSGSMLCHRPSSPIRLRCTPTFSRVSILCQWIA